MSLTARSPWVGNIHGRFCVLSHVVSLVWNLLDAVVRDDFYAVDLGGFGILGDYICSETQRCASDLARARLSFWEVTTGRRYVDHYVELIGLIKLQMPCSVPRGGQNPCRMLLHTHY